MKNKYKPIKSAGQLNCVPQCGCPDKISDGRCFFVIGEGVQRRIVLFLTNLYVVFFSMYPFTGVQLVMHFQPIKTGTHFHVPLPALLQHIL